MPKYGDLMSGLMAMEGNNLISSRDRSLHDIIRQGAEIATQRLRRRSMSSTLGL